MAQACVGHCESSAFPLPGTVLVASGYRHNITSRVSVLYHQRPEEGEGAELGSGSGVGETEKAGT